MLAIMFPGQGAQVKGMGKELFLDYQDMLQTADQILEYSIADACLNNPNGLLDNTLYTQPLLYVINCLSWLKYRDQGNAIPQYFLGHSLGEYPALFAAGMIDFEQGLRIVKKRAELMSLQKGGGMAAVLNIRADALRATLDREEFASIDIANLNSPKQTIVAGPQKDLLKLKDFLTANKLARCFPLNVSGAFHSRSMQKAKLEFLEFLKTQSFAEPQIPVISQNDLSFFTSSSAVDLLGGQLTESVQFIGSVTRLHEKGVVDFLELGVGTTLTKFVRDILAEFNDAVVPMNAEMKLCDVAPEVSSANSIGHMIDWLEYRVQKDPQEIAVRFLEYKDHQRETLEISFQELFNKARSIAASLQRRGLQKGDRVIIFGINSRDNLYSIFGAILAGAIFTLVPPPIDESKQIFFRSVLDSTKARFILANTLVTEKLEAKLSQGKVPLWALRKGLKWFKNLEIINIDLCKDAADQWVRPNLQLNDLLYLQYSSGSTQAPKGVMISHGNLIENSIGFAQLFLPKISRKDDFNYLLWAPIFHNTGLLGLFQFLFLNCKVHIMSPLAFIEKPLRWFEAISDFKINVINAPNSIYDTCALLVRDKDLQNLSLATVEIAGNGAEPVHFATLQRFAKKFSPYGFRAQTFMLAYGLAESTCIVSASTTDSFEYYIDALDLKSNSFTVLEKSHPRAKSIVPVGRPLPGVNVIIVDPETLKPIPATQIGEICVQGPSVAQGYWQDKAMTQATFDCKIEGYSQNFMRTGDLGIMHNGLLFITGRHKELMIVNGHNVYPQDIEQNVRKALPLLEILRIVSFSIEKSQVEGVVLCLELNRNKQANLISILDVLNKSILKDFGFTPMDIVLVDEGGLPKTNTGKVQTLKTKELYASGNLSMFYSKLKATPLDVAPMLTRAVEKATEDTVKESPHSASVQVILDFLVQECALALKLTPVEINVDANLSDLGLDSLTLTFVTTQLSERFELTVDPTIFFESPSLQVLAEKLNERVAAQGNLDLLSQGAARDPGFKVRADEETSDLVAIVGVSVQLPESENLHEFWQHLIQGDDLIREIPQDRWDWQELEAQYPHLKGRLRWGGFLRNVRGFDAAFFGISPKEAQLMDPQQRMFLEASWLAMEDAGYSAAKVSGTSLGVFVGASTQDYAQLIHNSNDQTHPFAATGNAKTMIANRVSFYLNVSGPSETIDTACSSSLVAIHRAVESLRKGECQMAIAGGVNLILAPEISIALSQAGMLSPDGRCKTFDQSAQGYVRSEGVGAFVLKSLELAKKDRDHIYAVIRGSQVNHGGRAATLTAPNTLAQAQLLERTWDKAHIDVSTLNYIETHGTGTSLGDPIEFNALSQAFKKTQFVDKQSSCYLGSVKSHVGHLESAAGVAGLAKLLMALKHEWLPANLHIAELNRFLKVDGSPFVILQDSVEWKSKIRFALDSIPRRAGLSSFGFGGTNAHLVVEEAPWIEPHSEETMEGPYAFVLSAKSNVALIQKLRNLLDFIEGSQNPIHLPALAANLYFGRDHFVLRLVFIAKTHSELISQLKNCLHSSQFKPNQLFANTDLDSSNNGLETKLDNQNSLIERSRLWLEGKTTDHLVELRADGYQKIPLPGYAFDRADHWLSITQRPRNVGDRDISSFQKSQDPYSETPENLQRLQHDLIAFLMEVIEDALGQKFNGMSDMRFDELGIDSLVGMQILSHLNASLALGIKPSILIEFSSARSLAQYLLEHHRDNLVKKFFPGTRASSAEASPQPSQNSSSEDAVWAPCEILEVSSYDSSVGRLSRLNFKEIIDGDRVDQVHRLLTFNPLLRVKFLLQLSNGKRMELSVSGRGKPMLFLSAFGLNSTQWDLQVRSFSDRYQVIGMTLPGLGRSESFDSGDQMTFSDAIKEALELLNIKESAHVIGSSFGGIVGRHFASQFPTRVASLTLANSPRELAHLPSLQEFRTSIKTDVDLFMNPYQQQLFEDSTESIDINFYRNLMGQQSLSVPVSEIPDHLPVLVIGGRHDRIVSWKDAVILNDSIKGSDIQIYEDSGHFPNISHSEHFNTRLLNFIETC